MSNRFEDTNGLFGQDIGHGTNADVSCQWCGTDYTDRENDIGEGSLDSETLLIDYFGDLQVLDCCFAKVENAMLENAPRIIAWYTRVLQRNREELERRFGALGQLEAVVLLASETGGEKSNLVASLYRVIDQQNNTLGLLTEELDRVKKELRERRGGQ